MCHSPESWTLISAITSPSFSKDGSRLFHMRGSGQQQPWVMDLDGSNARPVATWDEKAAMLRRSPADDRVIVGVDAGGDERQQLYLVETDSGTIRNLTQAPDVIHNFGTWSSDGTRIVYTANNRDEKTFDVLVRDIATGTVALICEGESQISVAGWSGDRLAVISDRSAGDQTLWVFDLVTGEKHPVPAPGPTRYQSIRFTPEGALMGLTDHGGSDFMRLCRIDPCQGVVSIVHDAPARDVEAWSQAPNGGRLAVVENDRGYAVLKVDGEMVLDLPRGIVADLDWSPDGTTLAFTAQSPTEPAGIFLWKDGKAALLLRADPMAEAGIEDSCMVHPHLVEWVATDGKLIPGWFALPRTPKPEGGYPAVVWVHGGPAAQMRANFRPDTQLLLDQGFAVLLPNVRGSTGYGRAYMESDDVYLRPMALADVGQGHNWLAKRPDINPDKIGIMGQSYGGWMVLAAVTLQPDLWKAAVDYYGIADFVSFIERTSPWMRDYAAREFGFPGVNEDLFARISPIHHIDNLKAPILIAHGDRDARVPKHESDQFVSALLERQKNVIYEEFEYAGHGFIRSDHRKRIMNAVAKHFQQFLE